jgi:hypothetical protein
MMANRVVSCAVAFIVATAMSVPGCSGSEPDDGDSYRPAEIEEIEDSDATRVTLTADAAARIGLELASAQRNGEYITIPYAALIYDDDGEAWVFEADAELTFIRTGVVVDRVEGDVAWLSEGLSHADPVVTAGATELYGAELEIDGGH